MENPMQAQEVTLPDNHRSRLATAFWSALQFSQGLTDFIVHEGKPVYGNFVEFTVNFSYAIARSNFPQ
jgi:hypothetical protein